MKIELVIDGCAVWSNNGSTSRVSEAQKKVHGPAEAAQQFSAISDLQQEAFAVIEYNSANEPQGPARIVTLGLLNSNLVDAREVFSDPLKNRAASIIVAHNHPSGNLQASPEDVAITDRLAKAGKILGIEVLDHIILAPGGKYLSMKAEGYL